MVAIVQLCARRFTEHTETQPQLAVATSQPRMRAVRGASGPSAHARDLPYWRSRRLAAQTNRCASSLAGPWGVSAHQYGVALFLLAGVVVQGGSRASPGLASRQQA